MVLLSSDLKFWPSYPFLHSLHQPRHNLLPRQFFHCRHHHIICLLVSFNQSLLSTPQQVPFPHASGLGAMGAANLHRHADIASNMGVDCVAVALHGDADALVDINVFVALDDDAYIMSHGGAVDHDADTCGGDPHNRVKTDSLETLNSSPESFNSEDSFAPHMSTPFYIYPSSPCTSSLTSFLNINTTYFLLISYPLLSFSSSFLQLDVLSSPQISGFFIPSFFIFHLYNCMILSSFIF